MKEKVRKLRGTSLDELRVRGSQAISAFMERSGWTRQTKVVSDETFVRLLDLDQFADVEGPLSLKLRDRFREKTRPAFFAAFADSEATVRELRKRWQNAEAEIVGKANRIKAGHFDLLGYRNLYFGNPIDWHFEGVAHKRAPLVHWSRLNYLDAELFGDKKIIWELNRHQYFITLGQAYWLTGDETYAQTFASHINSWMDQNPPKLGINWASSLEVAFRSISWLWAISFFKHSPALDQGTFLRIWKFLYLNARHIETYLSIYFSPNTHLTGEALGLFYLGTLLPEFKEATRWRNSGLQILLDQLPVHVKSDGVYFEQSSYYHRYTADFFLHLRILLSANGETVPAELDEKLQALMDHLMYLTRPDGATPLFGDDDGGRLLSLDYYPCNDFRSTVSTAAAVLRRSDYKFVAGGAREETLWLLGPTGLACLDQIEADEPAKQSIAFPVSGYYVMRDGWKKDSNYLLFDCGPHGVDNCGHAHADVLSFELAVKGKTLLVDPGTYTYTASKELRDWFRGSTAHNTLTIDEEPSSVPAGPFSWKTVAGAKALSWISHDRFDYVSGSHDGFARLAVGANHTRSIFFLKNNYWVILDRVESLGDHQIQLWFHLDIQVEPLHSRGNSIRLLGGDSTLLQIATFPTQGKWNRKVGWVSHCYGEKEEAPVFSFCLLGKGSQEVVTFLLPENTGAKPTVLENEALNGKSFEIDINGKHDVLLLRGSQQHAGALIETARFTSDFDTAWVRFANKHARTPEELVLIGGQNLELEGHTLLKSTKTMSYLAASSIGDRYRIATDGGVLDISLPVADLDLLLADLNQQ